MPIEQLLKRSGIGSVETREPAAAFADPLTLGPPAPGEGPYLEVRSVASGLATLYEKFRNTLDYRDEHLIRVYAIRRILKRRLVRGAQAHEVTQPLLQELIRGGYVGTNAIPERELPLYHALITKYIQLFHWLVATGGESVSAKTWDWVFVLAANELEERLVPAPHRALAAERLIQMVIQQQLLRQWNLSQEEEWNQATIAVCRSLLKLNNDMISWVLFRHEIPRWLETPDEQEVVRVAQHFLGIQKRIDAALRSAAGDRLSRHIKPASTTLWLLLETMQEAEDRPSLLERPSLLKTALLETISSRSKSIRRRLSRTLRRSLLYIFLTKMALALLVEVPFDRLVQGSVNYTNLAFNIAAPLLLLLIFGLLVRVPGQENTEAIVSTAEAMVYGGSVSFDPLRPPASHRAILNRLFQASYTVIYLVTFGVIVTILLRFGFTVLGILLFLLFLSIVSFFGFRIREQAQDLIVIKGQERFLVFLAVLFFLPILRTGRWISQQSSKINVFLYLVDLFIEAPLQAFLEFFDKFTGFVREKKDDVTS
ncbi:MAG: hypothetical protein HY566_00880 [Candidatus Kerfeldbacteria bacterium]|nr:hypothetical protein [Candidatus Kerfeldbacteria bacterium]